MKLLQNQLKEKCDKDLADVTKLMNNTCLAKEQELRDLKNSLQAKRHCFNGLKIAACHLANQEYYPKWP